MRPRIDIRAATIVRTCRRSARQRRRDRDNQRGQGMIVRRRDWLVGMAMVLTAASPALAQQQFNWQQAKGSQLRVMLNKHPWQGAIEPHLKEFEALTGVKLVTEVY